LEVTPYARWTGSLLLRTLSLEGWHRHVLVIGIEDRGALAGLPAAGNRRGGRYGIWSLLFLVPATALLWSLGRLARPAYRETRLGKYILKTRQRSISHGLIGITALAFL